MNEQLRLAIAEAAKSAGKSSTNRSAYAEVVMELVQPQHLTLDVFNAFMPVRQMQPGDTFAKRIRKGRYPVRTMVPGTKHLTDVVWNAETQAFMFDRLIAGTNHSVWEIENGEVGTVESMRDELRSAIFDNIVANVFTVLSTAWNGTDTPDNYTDVSGTGVTEAALDAMIETVLDHSGEVRAITGTRKALLPIYKFAQFREYVLGGTGNNPDRVAVVLPDAFNEFARTRRVSTYYGIPLIEIPTVYDGTLGNVKTSLVDTDKVLVIGDDAGEIGLMGGTEYQDYTDPTTQPANYVLHAWQAYGMIVDDIEAIGVLKTDT